MKTNLHSFIDLYNTSFLVDKQPVKLNKIVIPIIQRDYAQGRLSPDINRVRERFLDSLFMAITKKPITLDFIYGDLNEKGEMYPLDGQQRLTTLFLLHWYAAKKENIPVSEYSFLSNFSYETRYSARDFCSHLTNFNPIFNNSLSNEIINQHWFPLDWKKDPTVSSMLVMLDAIQDKFKDVDNIWESLKSDAITFYFLAIKDMGLTDELYIKMNSRGKPLTPFEHFKTELERKISSIDKDRSKEILRKIDIDWTELLWEYRGDNNITDDEFLRYFKFICDIICYKQGNSPQGRSMDEFDLLNEYFSDNGTDTLDNLNLMENYFDCWSKLEESPSQFLTKFISHQQGSDKVKIENRDEIDIFSECLSKYSDTSGRRRAFPLNRIVMLYAIISYLLNKSSISESQFSRRFRIINNLINNSVDEISDSEARSSGNRMPAILKQVDHIMLNGTIGDDIDKNFSVVQLGEERKKISWLQKYPEKAENLFKLEDHTLLQGQIGIVGLENYEYFERFHKLFDCNYDNVDCALMSIKFYGQQEQNGWRYQLGSSSLFSPWRELFHKSSNKGYENTKAILIDLLSKTNEIDDDYLVSLTTDFIYNCEINSVYDWRYYYVKYPSFRPGSYGKYSNRNMNVNPYLFTVMTTRSKVSQNSYMPFLKIASEKNLSKDSYGRRLLFKDYYIYFMNNSFVIASLEDDKEIKKIEITKNENNIDTENRIEKLISFLNKDKVEVSNILISKNTVEHGNLKNDQDKSNPFNLKKKEITDTKDKSNILLAEDEFIALLVKDNPKIIKENAIKFFKDLKDLGYEILPYGKQDLRVRYLITESERFLNIIYFSTLKNGRAYKNVDTLERDLIRHGYSDEIAKSFYKEMTPYKDDSLGGARTINHDFHKILSDIDVVIPIFNKLKNNFVFDI